MLGEADRAMKCWGIIKKGSWEKVWTGNPYVARVGIPREGHGKGCRLGSALLRPGGGEGLGGGQGPAPPLTLLFQHLRHLIQPVSKCLFLDINLFQK